MPTPDAIDIDSRGQRMRTAGQPAGQFGSTTAMFGEDRLGAAGLHHFRKTALDRLTQVAMTATNVDWHGVEDFVFRHGHSGGHVW